MHATYPSIRLFFSIIALLAAAVVLWHSMPRHASAQTVNPLQGTVNLSCELEFFTPEPGNDSERSTSSSASDTALGVLSGLAVEGGDNNEPARGPALTPGDYVTEGSPVSLRWVVRGSSTMRTDEFSLAELRNFVSVTLVSSDATRPEIREGWNERADLPGPRGVTTVRPQGDQNGLATYRLLVSGDSNADGTPDVETTCEARIRVAAAPEGGVWAQKERFLPGDDIALGWWQRTGEGAAAQITLDGGRFTDQPLPKNSSEEPIRRTDRPRGDTAYTLTVTNRAGDTHSSSVQVTEADPADACWFTDASENAFATGQLEWGVAWWARHRPDLAHPDPVDATLIVRGGEFGSEGVMVEQPTNPSGSIDVAPEGPTTYTLSIRTPDGTEAQCDEVTVDAAATPGPEAPPTCTLAANGNTQNVTIHAGDEIELSWTQANDLDRHLSGGVFSDGFGASDNGTFTRVGRSGSRTVSPSETTTYEFTVEGSDGSTTRCLRRVRVVPPPRCGLFVDGEAADTTIEAGESVTLSWNKAHAAALRMYGGRFGEEGQLVASGARREVSPTSTTVYRLVASGRYDESQQAVCTREVQVLGTETEPAPTCTLEAAAATLEAGEQTVLRWSTTGGTSVTLNGDAVAQRGSRTVQPAASTDYVLSVQGPGGSTDCRTSVERADTIQTPRCVLLNTSATQLPAGGGEVTLSWQTKNADEVRISGLGSVAPDNTLGETLMVNETTEFRLVARGADGTTDSCTHTVTVSDAAAEPTPPTCTMASSPEIITPGESAVVWWGVDSRYADTVRLDGEEVPFSGRREVSPSNDREYELFVSGEGGTRTCRTTVYTSAGSDTGEGAGENWQTRLQNAIQNLLRILQDVPGVDTGNNQSSATTSPDTPPPEEVVTVAPPEVTASVDGNEVTIDIALQRDIEGVNESCFGSVILASVRWGDGATEDITALGCTTQDQFSASYQYSGAGSYDIEVEDVRTGDITTVTVSTEGGGQGGGEATPGAPIVNATVLDSQTVELAVTMQSGGSAPGAICGQAITPVADIEWGDGGSQTLNAPNTCGGGSYTVTHGYDTAAGSEFTITVRDIMNDAVTTRTVDLTQTGSVPPVQDQPTQELTIDTRTLSGGMVELDLRFQYPEEVGSGACVAPPGPLAEVRWGDGSSQTFTPAPESVNANGGCGPWEFTLSHGYDNPAGRQFMITVRNLQAKQQVLTETIEFPADAGSEAPDGTAVVPVSCSVSVSPQSGDPEGPVQIEWNTNNADSVRLRAPLIQGLYETIEVGASGTYEYDPPGPVTVTVLASHSSGSSCTDSVSIGGSASAEAGTTYTVSDVLRVTRWQTSGTGDPDADVYRYLIVLNSGVTHTVDVPISGYSLSDQTTLSQEAFYDTGFVGDVNELLDLVE